MEGYLNYQIPRYLLAVQEPCFERPWIVLEPIHMHFKIYSFNNNSNAKIRRLKYFLIRIMLSIYTQCDINVLRGNFSLTNHWVYFIQWRFIYSKYVNNSVFNASLENTEFRLKRFKGRKLVLESNQCSWKNQHFGDGAMMEKFSLVANKVLDELQYGKHSMKVLWINMCNVAPQIS